MGEREKRSIVIVAACALVNEARDVLIAKRPPGRSFAGLWELPGGKIEHGEGPEDALVRELKEELGIEIATADLKPLIFASHAYPDFHLLMPVYLCARWRGTLAAQEGQDLLWVRAEDLVRYDMPPADEPLKVALRDLLG
jgi:8-oxo-dGTP diphosphatase